MSDVRLPLAAEPKFRKLTSVVDELININKHISERLETLEEKYKKLLGEVAAMKMRMGKNK